MGWTGPTVVGHLRGAGFRISTSGAPERQGIVQRLDVGTSGVMVIAKSERAYSLLKNAFRHREVEKTYHALVQGHPDPLEGTIDAPIGRHTSSDWKFAVREDGKHSVTHYETLEAHRFASLLEVHLETGRTHQIRVHMAALKHPCVGRPDLRRRPDPGPPGGAGAAVAARRAARLRAPRHGGARRVRLAVPRRPGARARGHPRCRTEPTPPVEDCGPGFAEDLPAVHEVFLAAGPRPRPAGRAAYAGAGARLVPGAARPPRARAVAGHARGDRAGLRAPRGRLGQPGLRAPRPAGARRRARPCFDLVRSLRPDGFGLRVHQANDARPRLLPAPGAGRARAHRRPRLPRRRARPADGVARGATRWPTCGGASTRSTTSSRCCWRGVRR